MHIILSRTDNIGDVVLTLPMAVLLKKKWPGCKISLLGKSYTQSIAEHCTYVDNFLNYDEVLNRATNHIEDFLKKASENKSMI